MPNQRRVRGWLYGLGCAGLLFFLTVCSSVGITIYKNTPQAEIDRLFLFSFNGRIYDLKPNTEGILIFIATIVIGFLVGIEYNRWLYKE